MNGAQALIRTLVDSDVDVCFANPGTSEMHFVAALDAVPEMRAVLGLFEGVVTGAADGYGAHGRPSRRDAAPPRARPRQRHREPAQRTTGAHADREHRRRPRDLPPPVRRAAAVGHRQPRAERVGLDPQLGAIRGHRERRRRRGRRRAAATGPGRDPDPPGRRVVDRRRRARRPASGADAQLGRPTTRSPSWRRRSAPASRSPCCSAGPRLRERGLRAASRIAAGTGAKVIGETFPARLERGAGLPPLDRLGYLAEFAVAQLDGTRHLVIVDAKAPVSFFAYPGKPSSLVPDGCEVHVLAAGPDDSVDALERVADAVGAGDADPVLQAAGRPDRPTGPITGATIADAVGVRSCRTGRSSPTKRRPAGSGLRARLPADRATTGSPSAVDRSAWACRSRPARPSRAPTVR